MARVQQASDVPQLSIIVVSYNTRALTLDCLASIDRETACAFEVIVVDNASTDGSAEAIRETFPGAILLAEDVNLGFAAAHALAVQRCRAPWLLLLNPDTIVLDGALDKLLAFARRRPRAGIWGGRTLFADGSLNASSCWRMMTPWSLFCVASGLAVVFRTSDIFNREAYGNWPRDRERDVDIVTGCLFLIARETWDRLGGFDPAFVMYGEEADLCLRARQIGLRPAISPEATIVHYGGASERVAADKGVRLLKAKAELIKRHFSEASRGIGLWLLSMWPWSRYVVFAVLARFPGSAWHVEKAATWRQIWRRRGEWKDGMTKGATWTTRRDAESAG